MPDKIIIGKFGKTFGVRGWITVHSFADPKESIVNFRPWLLKKNSQWQEIAIEANKIQHQNTIVKLQGIDDIDAAKFFTNKEIFIDRELLPKLSTNEYYWNDLIGLKVINHANEELGTVETIFNSGASDILVVTGKKKHLIPYVKNYILNTDIKRKIITTDWDKNF